MFYLSLRRPQTVLSLSRCYPALGVLWVLLALVLAPLARAEVTQIDNEQLQQLIAQGVPVIDVRTRGEWRISGVVEGSHLLTFFDEKGNYDAEAWLNEFAKIAKPDQPVALICATGGRTTPITNFLDQQAGYSAVHNVTAGIRGWINDGGSTVPPTGP